MKKYNVTVNGTTYEVLVEEAGAVAAAPASVAAPVAAPAPAAAAAPAAAPAPAAKPAAPAAAGKVGAVQVTAPMPGTILKVEATVGQTVKKGDTLCILEAMKMENAIPAPEDGTVSSVNVTKGASVNAGDLLVSLS